jgi:hypothetical protein
VGQSQVNETEHSEQERLLMDVNVTPFEIETKTRRGDKVRADVYLPRNSAGPFPVLLGALSEVIALSAAGSSHLSVHRVWTNAALSR